MKTLPLCIVLVLLFASGIAVAQPGKSYTDSRGKKVFFPLGDLSFTDRVVAFEPGNPPALPQFSHPAQALGAPNFGPGPLAVEHTKAVSLGCGGTLTLQFVDNALVNIAGPDLYVFEAGEAIEPTALSISKDSENWISIGKISGGIAEIDIVKFATPNETFSFVRLTDLRTQCAGPTQAHGADIDAVGAIGAALTMSLNTSVLFDFNESVLKSEATLQLKNVSMKIKQYPGSRLMIGGHTDNVGSIEYNQILSKSRAGAVRDYFISTEKLQGYKIETYGYGKSRPIASNDTEEGREKNRRVEIILIPHAQ